jgi:hypothetical protein
MNVIDIEKYHIKKLKKLHQLLGKVPISRKLSYDLAVHQG